MFQINVSELPIEGLLVAFIRLRHGRWRVLLEGGQFDRDSSEASGGGGRMRQWWLVPVQQPDPRTQRFFEW